MATKYTIRIHVIPLSDTNGARANTVTAAKFATAVAGMNAIFEPADIRFAFDPEKDWHPRNDTSLNSLNNGGSSWWTGGNAVAKQHRGRMVVFLRWGKDQDKRANNWFAYPPNTGQQQPAQAMLFPDLSYMDNLCFTLDHRVPDVWRRAAPRESIRRELTDEGGNVPHLKLFVTGEGGDFAKVSLTGVDYALEFDRRLEREYDRYSVVVNARAACPSTNRVETARTLASRSRSPLSCSISSATVTSKSDAMVSSATPAASAAPAK